MTSPAEKKRRDNTTRRERGRRAKEYFSTNSYLLKWDVSHDGRVCPFDFASLLHAFRGHGDHMEEPVPEEVDVVDQGSRIRPTRGVKMRRDDRVARIFAESRWSRDEMGSLWVMRRSIIWLDYGPKLRNWSDLVLAMRRGTHRRASGATRCTYPMWCARGRFSGVNRVTQGKPR
jgi:hypothetical protein